VGREIEEPFSRIDKMSSVCCAAMSGTHKDGDLILLRSMNVVIFPAVKQGSRFLKCFAPGRYRRRDDFYTLFFENSELSRPTPVDGAHSTTFWTSFFPKINEFAIKSSIW